MDHSVWLSNLFEWSKRRGNNVDRKNINRKKRIMSTYERGKAKTGEEE
jgi:hypothetical protein